MVMLMFRGNHQDEHIDKRRLWFLLGVSEED